MPGIYDLFSDLVTFLQKKITKAQIDCSGVDKNQAKILEILTEEKTRESLIQLKSFTPREFQEAFLLSLGKLKNDGITMAQDADKNRESVDEFLQRGAF